MHSIFTQMQKMMLTKTSDLSLLQSFYGTEIFPIPDVLNIQGQRCLNGSVSIEGNKVSSVTMIAASLLTTEPVILKHSPDMLDHLVLCQCLAQMGADVTYMEQTLQLSCRQVHLENSLPVETFNSVHGTIYLLPTLLIRHGWVQLPRNQGGCNIGVRPIEPMVEVLQMLGAKVVLGETIEASVPSSGLKGCHIQLNLCYGVKNNKFISSATKTALLAGVLANGETVIEGAYWGRFIIDLCSFLRSMGAQIEGEGTRCIRIQGVTSLHGTHFTVPSDPQVLSTYIGAVAVTGGQVHFQQASLTGMDVEVAAFRSMGISIEQNADTIVVICKERLRPVVLTTETLPTDVGPIFAVLMSLADGPSSLEEVIWEHRFGYASQLRYMGGLNNEHQRTLYCTGVPTLRAAPVHAPDLRSAAALVLAGLSAQGTTQITGTSHLVRGYANLPQKLNALGANIQPVFGDLA
ncbi:UDP-N-acetylglucosamine 1-carboxyvinyltransferase [Nodosilinea sp. LEGE 07298]|uniref:UDP-N-acetylglucosamine 1-carboxyvinyltransferase n=1 Tax=Nodosilinea sp. LEGE 07298 TaxID=2777970 RepID=UPI00187F7E1F|nr:UDP-N-acetylglucosamine 1-carboxyvinyltransferase [Nodosilinea sp. LEGE 07298]MBE9108128.1 UDP-N-acetylglucosamine 1-carboxyvinyltransferase [Nodosilinea sp. LEGE 07298]